MIYSIPEQEELAYISDFVHNELSKKYNLQPFMKRFSFESDVVSVVFSLIPEEDVDVNLEDYYDLDGTELECEYKGNTKKIVMTLFAFEANPPGGGCCLPPGGIKTLDY